MAESWREKRLRELSGQSSQPTTPKTNSWREQRVKELRGEPASTPSLTEGIPTPLLMTNTINQMREQPSTPGTAAVGSSIAKPAAPQNPLLMTNTINQVRNNINANSDEAKAQQYLEKQRNIRAAQDPSNPLLRGVKNYTVDLLGEAIDRLSTGTLGNNAGGAGAHIQNTLNKIGLFGNRMSQSAGNVLGVDVQSAGAPPLQSTGSKIADTTADVTGAISGLAANPAQIEQNLFTLPYKAAQGLTSATRINRGINAVQNALESGVNRLNPALNQAGINIGSNLTRNAVNRGVQGAVAGGIQGGVLSGVRGETDAGELAKNIGVGAALGGVGDAALSVFGRAIADSKIGQSFKDFLSRQRSISPEVEQSFRQTFEANPSSRLKIQPNDRYVDKVMTEIKPIVQERMTPPLENPNELAKWLKPHLGENVSLNEIRKLSYDDMSQLANEVKNNMSMYDVAKQVAREKGYNLERAFNKRLPTLTQEAERLRMGRVAGAIDAPPTTRIATRPEFTPSSKPEAPRASDKLPAPAMKGDWFTDLFGNRGVGITPGSGARGRNRLTTEGQIVDNPLRRDLPGVKNEIEARARAAYQNQIDELNPLKYISRDVYDAAADVRRANNVANTISQDKFVDLEGNIIGPGLKEIMNKVARGQGHAFEDYLILRHALTRMSRGERVYDPKLEMTPQKVQQRLDMYNTRHPEFQEIAREWDEFNENLLRVFGEKEGLLSKAQVDAMREANPNYAPMRRQFSANEKYANRFASSSGGFSGKKAPIKEVSPTGSVRKIVSPVKTAIESTGAWTQAAMRNRVMQEVVKRLKADPQSLKGIVEIVPETAEATKKSLNDINKLLENDGMEGLLEALNNDFSVLFKKGKNISGKTDNTVRAMVNGQPVKLKVENPEVMKALVGLGPEQSDFIMDMFGMLSSATKHGATGAFAPLFALKSISWDVATAMIQSKNAASHIVDLGHALFSSLANKLPKNTPGSQQLRALAQDFQRTGGEFSAILMGDRKLNRSVKGMLREPILGPKNIAKAAISPVTKVYKGLRSISDVTENLNRMAAYKGELRRLGGERTPENIRKAMRESQEITTNYSRKGSMGKQIEKFIPYHNAAVQGLRRFAVQFKNNPIKTLGFVTLGILLPKAWEYSQFSDDPDFQKIPARERYRNLYFSKNKDGTFNKIPLPPEYSALGSFFTDILQEINAENPVNWRQSADAIVNAFTPPVVSGSLQGLTQGGGGKQSFFGALNSTSLAPFIAVGSNQSFTGAPITPQRLAENSPEERYDERTSSLSKWAGQNIGVFSPMEWDYLLRAYGGDPARLLLPLTSDVGAGTTKNTLLRNFITDPVFTNTLSADFYDMKQKIVQANSNMRTNGTPYPSWYKEDIAKQLTTTAKGSITKQISELNTEKRSIQGNRELTAEQKAQQLRDIQAQINDIYLQAITLMKENGVPTGRN